MKKCFKNEEDLVLELIKALEAQYDYMISPEDEQMYKEWLDWLRDKYDNI